MSFYRTHLCSSLSLELLGKVVTVTGWVQKLRHHGQVVFLDMRDHTAVLQCVAESTETEFGEVSDISLESVVQISGIVRKRPDGSEQSDIITGDVELSIQKFTILSKAEQLPFSLQQEFIPENLRLSYRFLDMRRECMRSRILLRDAVIHFMREHMRSLGFIEISTPILTASSPEGARDYLVPSRMHPGMVYALPQAPQQFKQILMAGGFSKYFQIAPCFRDEDSRADRVPGEFYQLDFEMSFVDQEEVFEVTESLLHSVFSRFSSMTITKTPFPRITYRDSMEKYGTDKPDLRNPLQFEDISNVMSSSGMKIFVEAISKGARARSLFVPDVVFTRSEADKMQVWAKENDAPGVAYITWQDGKAGGPLAKFLSDKMIEDLFSGKAKSGTMFVLCIKESELPNIHGQLRSKLGQILGYENLKEFSFCWITDFPMYELDEQTGNLEFSHNPFSMPKRDDVENDPLELLAYQYDIVCNGVELSSGAIRNHNLDLLKRTLAMAGHTTEDAEMGFPGLISAMRYGMPPHGGCAPGIDRILMLITEMPNLREVIAFPLNQQGQDLLLNAPSAPTKDQIKELRSYFCQQNK